MSRPCRSRNPVEPHKPRPALFRSSLRQSLADRQHRVSLSETYAVAITCKRKLGFEADRADHQLHRLVCHANMLDALMEELADRERGLQGNLSAIISTAPQPHSGQQVQWLDRIAEESEEEESDSESNLDFDYSSDEGDVEDEIECKIIVAKKTPPPMLLGDYFAQSDEESEDDEEAHDYELVLKRCPSKKLVRELTNDEDSDPEEEQSAGRFRSSFTKQCTVTITGTPNSGAAPRLISKVRIAAVAVD